MCPLVGHGIARGALGLTRLHVVLFSNSGWLVAKRHSSGGCEFACDIFYAQCLFLGYVRSGLLLYRQL